ncbi:hypothetical protein [Paraburkholderia sp. C35]|uniref:hypothetical protein n=1 Tax=Paraburkholderia sp. C35 TaxID=2126993 RepID=UPI000D690FF4|nr:hypothetical protein [Paraburkholderia sp. C35]
MIKPSIGRVVWFTPEKNDALASDQQLAALIAYVHSDRSVNLAVFDACGGGAHSRTSVTLLQGDDLPPEGGGYAEWMPFQKGQAVKHEQKENAQIEKHETT